MYSKYSNRTYFKLTLNRVESIYLDYFDVNRF